MTQNTIFNLVPLSMTKTLNTRNSKKGNYAMTNVKYSLATLFKCKFVIAQCKGEVLLEKIVLLYVCTQPPSTLKHPSVVVTYFGSHYENYCKFWKIDVVEYVILDHLLFIHSIPLPNQDTNNTNHSTINKIGRA